MRKIDEKDEKDQNKDEKVNHTRYRVILDLGLFHWVEERRVRWLSDDVELLPMLLNDRHIQMGTRDVMDDEYWFIV